MVVLGLYFSSWPFLPCPISTRCLARWDRLIRLHNRGGRRQVLPAFGFQWRVDTLGRCLVTAEKHCHPARVWQQTWASLWNCHQFPIAFDACFLNLELGTSHLWRSVSMIFNFPENPGQAFDRRFRNIASRFTSLLGICYEPATCVCDTAITSFQTCASLSSFV